MTEYKKREINALLARALKTLPVVVLTGMRQTGKTTLLREEPAFRDRRYYSLDDFATLEAARSNPEEIVSSAEPVTIDEIQRCPELLVAIKRRVDDRRNPGHFLLSGSANFSLLKGAAETLAGRSVYLPLNPFTRREILGNINSESVLIRFLRDLDFQGIRKAKLTPFRSAEALVGGMPSIALHGETDISIWFKGYEQTYLERDIRELSQVADLLSFRNLLRLAALRSSQVLKISELARDAKLSSATASRYLNLAEMSFVVRRLSPFLSNRSSRLIKSPKLFFSDSGLACYMARVENLEAETDEPLRGAMFESYVAQNLHGLLDAHLPSARLYFWNVQGRYEVDFVVEHGRRTVAVEVKAASRWAERDLAGLRAFIEATPSCAAGILAYGGIEAVSLGDKLWAVPVSMLLS